MFGIAIDLRGECPHCGRPVMVNALTDRIHCPSCLKERPYPFTEWADLLESAWNLGPDNNPGQGGTTTVLGENWHLLYARFDPYCYACKYDFDMDLVVAAPAPYACPKCGARWHHRPAPQGANAALPGVKWLVAEDSNQLSGGGPETPAPQGSKPILFSCMGCGGSLEVDGSERVVSCGFCDASNYLPDDLWLRMHPVETVRRWFLWCDKETLPPGDEEDEEDEEDVEEGEFLADHDDGDSELERALTETEELTDAELTMESPELGADRGVSFQPDRLRGDGRGSARRTGPPGTTLYFLLAAMLLVVGVICAAIWYVTIVVP